MTHLEEVQGLLNELKTCAPEEISKHLSPAIFYFRTLAHSEKVECAMAFHQWAEENAELQPLKLHYAEFLKGMGYHLSEQHDQGLYWLSLARGHFEELHDELGTAICTVLMGNVYRTFGNFDLSLKTFWEAYGTLKESGKYPFLVSACTNGMAFVNLELRNLDEARLMFDATIEQCAKYDDYYFTIYALQGLAKVLMEQNDFDEAKKRLEEAYQMAKDNENTLAITTSLTELADFYFRTNDFKQSEELHKQALVIREENHFMGGAVTNCIHLGEIYIKESKWDEAIQVLNKALTLAEELKIKPKIARVHLLLSEIYQKRKDLEKSLFHFQTYHNINAQVEKEDNARKLKDAKLIFEAEQTKKENVIIKKQKQEIEIKNIELQETIDELTITKISRRAKALTLGLAIVLFIFEDPIIGFALNLFSSTNYFLSLTIKMVVIFSLSPINGAIEKYLLKRVVKKRKKQKEALNQVPSFG